MSAGSDVAARAGAEMFARGGHAVDAAVFALTVVDPAARASAAPRCRLIVTMVPMAHPPARFAAAASGAATRTIRIP